MPTLVGPEMVETVTRGLMGAVDVEGGATDEQVAVLQAIVSHLWHRPDIDPKALDTLGPGDVAAAVTDADARRRVFEMLVLLELCRHPESQSQVDRVEEYARAIGIDGPELEVTRRWMHEGAAAATADYLRVVDEQTTAFTEVSLRGHAPLDDGTDPELAARLGAMLDLPEGTLGHAYVEFYRRNGFKLPGSDATATAFFVSHDMNHVIAGYEPLGTEEIALSAFLLAMNDDETNRVGLLGSLLVHEAGVFEANGFIPKAATLARPGATELLGEAFERGAQCTSDFSHADHLAMVEWPLADVRAHFGVVPRATVSA